MTDHVPSPVLDVRGVPKPLKHPAIFDRYRRLGVGESFVLVNDHNPIHLRQEFDIEHPGSYGWEYLSQSPRDWQIQITKRAAAPLPHVLVNTAAFGADAAGVAFSIGVRERDLDLNVIALPAAGVIESHTGPAVDVVIHVISGSGVVETELGDLTVTAGDVVFLPRVSHRGFRAGADGLRYLTVHRKRESLPLTDLFSTGSSK
ncbi:MAG: DUF2249 domain-containing protein [Nocardiaceae bacterium]|nr:DUF2249 domain-containing protein [Nocardiaceae bacterium]